MSSRLTIEQTRSRKEIQSVSFVNTSQAYYKELKRFFRPVIQDAVERMRETGSTEGLSELPGALAQKMYDARAAELERRYKAAGGSGATAHADYFEGSSKRPGEYPMVTGKPSDVREMRDKAVHDVMREEGLTDGEIGHALMGTMLNRDIFEYGELAPLSMFGKETTAVDIPAVSDFYPTIAERVDLETRGAGRAFVESIIGSEDSQEETSN